MKSMPCMAYFKETGQLGYKHNSADSVHQGEKRPLALVCSGFHF